MKEVRTWKPFPRQQSLSTFHVTNVKRWSSLLLPLAKVTLSRKVFTTPGSLRNHTKIHTGATSCPVCSRQLATVSSLNRHMKSEHRDALDALWTAADVNKGPLSNPVSFWLLLPSLWMNWWCVAFQATTGATTSRLLGRPLASNISVQPATTRMAARPPWSTTNSPTRAGPTVNTVAIPSPAYPTWTSMWRSIILMHCRQTSEHLWIHVCRCVKKYIFWSQLTVQKILQPYKSASFATF